MQLHVLSLNRINELITKKEISAEELTKAYLEQISRVEDDIKAYVTVNEEEASVRAGIPVAVQDNICTKGVKTTCASNMLANFISPYDAVVVENLRKAGASLIGKCNMDEFAMGNTTEYSAFFRTKNPYLAEAMPSGCGCAAAVAAGEAAFALGSDASGGIRQAAAFCGVFGLKPTYGLVSQYGLITYAPSLDQIGPLTRDMTDLALVLNIICGRDSVDSGKGDADLPDYKKHLVNDVKGLKIGVPIEYLNTVKAPRVAAKIQEAIRKLEELGAVCEEVTMPHAEFALPAHCIISSAEASSNLARYDGVRYGSRVESPDVLNMFKKTRSQGFGEEVKRRIMFGTQVLSTGCYEQYYTKAMKVRTLVKNDFDLAFEKYDCLLTPTVPATAYKTGEKALAMYQSDFCTIPVNMAGLPAMSLPFGMAENLPVGLQLIAGHFNEGMLLRVGYTLEQNTDQTRLRPDISGL